jgi:hypothetical protein
MRLTSPGPAEPTPHSSHIVIRPTYNPNRLPTIYSLVCKSTPSHHPSRILHTKYAESTEFPRTTISTHHTTPTSPKAPETSPPYCTRPSYHARTLFPKVKSNNAVNLAATSKTGNTAFLIQRRYPAQRRLYGTAVGQIILPGDMVPAVTCPDISLKYS